MHGRGKTLREGLDLCQYAVRETLLWKRRDYSRRGRHNNEEGKGLVEGTKSDDIERVALWAIAGSGLAVIGPADIGAAGVKPDACSCECSDGKRQPQD